MKSAEYENATKKGITLLLAQPNSGMELVMKLMTSAWTKVCGNHQPSFYQGLLSIYEAAQLGLYGDPHGLEVDGFKYYISRDQASSKSLTYYHLKNLLIRGSSSIGMAATDVVGYNNTLTEKFVAMVRDICESTDTALTVGWLMSKNFESERILNNQYLQFRKAYELGDALFKLEDLLEDPLKWVLKLKPSTYPDEVRLKQIIKDYQKL